MRHSFIVLDFDGPIVELFDRRTGVQATRRIEEVAARFGISNSDNEQPQMFIDAWSRLRGLVGSFGGDVALFDHVVHAELSEIERGLLGAKQLALDSRRMLETVRGVSDRTGIVSNNSREAIRTWIEANSLSHLFDVVEGRTEHQPYENLKPQPQLMMRAAVSMGCEPRDIVFIGDSEADRQCARAAGATFFAFGENIKGIDELHRFRSRDDVTRYFRMRTS